MWGYKIVQPLQESVWQFHSKFNINLTYNPGIPLLDKEPREMKTYVYKKDLQVNVCSSTTHE